MLRQAIRSLRSAPALTIAIIALLAVGIGGNLIVFSLIDTVLFRARPGVRDPKTLVHVWRSERGNTTSFDATSYPDFVEYRRQNEVFTHLAGQDLNSFHLFHGGSVERLEGSLVTANYFDAIGTRPAAGRFFSENEESVAVISHRLWERKFGAKPETIGAKVDINGIPHTIVGVAERNFHGYFIGANDVWVPIVMAPRFYNTPDLLTGRNSTFFLMFARLKPGVTIDHARANLAAIAKRLELAFPEENKGKEVKVTAYSPVGEPFLDDEIATLMRAVTGVFLLALIVVCANVAALLVARSAMRQRDSAIRLALGVSRSRLVAQSLVDGFLLAMGATVVSIFLWSWTSSWVQAMIPDSFNGSAVWFTFDWRLALAAFALALASTAAFALVPGVQAARVAVLPALRSGEHSTISSRNRLQQGLTVVQVALCVVLVAAAGLLWRSLGLLRALDARIHTESVLVASIDPERSGYKREQSPRVLASIVESVKNVPGVLGAAIAKKRVFDNGIVNMGNLVYGGVLEAGGAEVHTNMIGPGYFETVGIPMRSGRDFTGSDALVVIVNESFAKKFWPGEDPIGKTIHPAAAEKGMRLRVVGVVANAPYRSVFDADQPLYYVPFAQLGWGEASLHVRTAAKPMAILPGIRKAVEAVDPRIPLHAVKTLADHREENFYATRLGATLIGTMAAFTLALAAVGLFAMLSFQVARRRREIGIRMALGASLPVVVRAVVSQGLWLVGVGLAIGLVLGFAAARLLSALLYGVKAHDPMTFATAAALLALAGVAASAIPALRAARVNPVEALRHD
ncbi:MAG: ABC transporter permease [Bryobacteraceae bacterium]